MSDKDLKIPMIYSISYLGLKFVFLSTQTLTILNFRSGQPILTSINNLIIVHLYIYTSIKMT